MTIYPCSPNYYDYRTPKVIILISKYRALIFNGTHESLLYISSHFYDYDIKN